MTVYFLEESGHIKIGYTTNLKARMKAYSPHANLLATRRGGKITEAQEHARWAPYRSGRREWFYPADDLMEYIEALDDPEPAEATLGGSPITLSMNPSLIIRAIREEASRSQEDLSFWSGVRRETISRFESQGANIGYGSLFAIVRSLGWELQIRKRVSDD